MAEVIFVCQNCGAQFPRWQGRCTQCGEWNSLVETVISKELKKTKKIGKTTEPQALAKISLQKFDRILTGISELDRVLGEGIVPGSVILLAGEPGIGKSTLVLQILGKIKEPSLYVSGEESPQQIKVRAERLTINSSGLEILPETNIESVIETISRLRPALVIIDSIQVMASDEFPGNPGGVGQVQICTSKLLDLAKQNNIPIILVGHVTKEGAIAGPKVLEHLVDVVLYLEGERYHDLRVLRGIKNRFGSTGEVGIFEMRERGMIEVKNPSEVLLASRQEAPGSVVAAVIEGNRPFLVEIQGLCSRTSFGYPKRASSGIDFNRLNLLIAVLIKRAGFPLFDQDIYLNVVGGFSLSEPALDLPISLAIGSSALGKVVKKDLVCFGEVGLTGELRQVSNIAKRIKEAEKLGFREVLLPALGLLGKEIKGGRIKILKAKTLKEAIDLALK